MIKRIFLGKHKVKFDFNEDLFFSIYRNDLFRKDLGNILNAENKEIFSIKSKDIIQNRDTIKNIINNILKKKIEKIASKNKRKIDATFFLSDGLISLTNVSWFIFLIFKRILEKYENKELEIILPTKFQTFQRPKSSFELHSLSHNANFIDLLAYKFFLKMCPSSWQIIFKENIIENIRMPKEENINFLARTFFGLSRCSHEQFDIFSSFVLGIFLWIKKVKRTNFFFQDKKEITTFENIEIPDKFNEIFSEIINQFLPEYFYSNLYKDFYLFSILPIYRSGYSRLLNTYSNNDRYNLFNMVAANKGEKLINFQHGLTYGTRLIMGKAEFREYLIGFFISWGWKSHGDLVNSLFKMPSPLLSKFNILRKKSEVKNHIIFVGTSMCLCEISFTSKPLITNLFKYREDKIKFLKNINHDIFSNLFYKGVDSNNNILLSDSKYLKEYITNLKICESNFRKYFSSCRLAVIDHPTTAFSESMTANIPTIGFWDCDSWSFTEEANYEFQKLKEVGILFDDPISAANKINQIYPNYEDWWNSEDIQAVRKDWCSKYALQDKNWLTKWISIF